MAKTVERKNYYKGNGKYQKLYDRFIDIIPNTGYNLYTDNEYFNLFIASSNLYVQLFDCYSKKDALKLSDDIERYIKPFSEYIISIDLNETVDAIIENLRLVKNRNKLETFLSEVLQFLLSKDLSYTKYILYSNYNQYDKNTEISLVEKEGFKKLTFGNKAEYDKFLEQGINIFKYKLL